MYELVILLSLWTVARGFLYIYWLAMSNVYERPINTKIVAALGVIFHGPPPPPVSLLTVIKFNLWTAPH